jgi:colicin import membrane protein
MADVKLVSIKMTRNKHGSPDGINVKHYDKGETYSVPESLGKLFVEADKVAEYVADQADEAAAAAKAEKERQVAEAKAAKEAEKAAKAEAAAKAKAEKAAQNKAEKAPKNKGAQVSA